MLLLTMVDKKRMKLSIGVAFLIVFTSIADYYITKYLEMPYSIILVILWLFFLSFLIYKVSPLIPGIMGK